jgi:chromate transporter
MVKYCDLFWSFFKIGTFTIGGGYAMIPLMEKELIERHAWLKKEEFLDLLSLSQAMPGLFAANMATGVGYRLRGKSGAAVAVIGNVMMPIVIILLMAIFFRLCKNNPIVEHVFMGLRPCVVALIAAPVFNMSKTAGIKWNNCWVPVVSALLIWLLGVSPVIIIIAAALLGFLYGRITKGKESQQ